MILKLEDLEAHRKAQPVDPTRCYAYLQKCSPLWDKKMGERLARARMVDCPRHGKMRVPVWMPEYQCVCVSQDYLARQLAVSRSVIQHIETGTHTTIPKFSVLQLHSALGDHTDYVLTGNGARRYSGEWYQKSWGWKEQRKK